MSRKSRSQQRAAKQAQPRPKVNLADAYSNFMPIKARFDAAQTTSENQNHWSMSDAMSARAAHDPATRRTLRMRSRYEVANNSWAAGIVRTLAAHTVGTGPRLNLLNVDTALADSVEQAFQEWFFNIGGPEKLLISKQTQIRDGEVFGQFVADDRNEYGLNFRLYEADQVSTPFPEITDPTLEDGVRLGPHGDPVEYYFFDHHPGDTAFIPTLDGKWYDADRVLHYYKSDRPGTVRGVPELMPALPLFALLRRFSLATVHAAESAALFAVFLKTTASASDIDQVDPFQLLQLQRNLMTTLPQGWSPEQLKPEHPATTYEMFVRAMLNEIARCLNMPYNIAAGNSSGYNYSSGRLDHQTYYRAIAIDQEQIERRLMDRIAKMWLMRASITTDLLNGINIDSLIWDWTWDSQPAIDERIEAEAATSRITSGLTTLPEEWKRLGLNGRRNLPAGAAALGMTVEQYQAAITRSLFGEPTPGAAVPGATAAPPAPTSTAFTSLGRRQYQNNRKAIDDELARYSSGESSETMTRVALRQLGLPDADIDSLIADIADDGQLSPETQEALQ
jgi:lambda family phage portal protein